MESYEEKFKDKMQLYGCTNYNCVTMGPKKLFGENGLCPYCRSNPFISLHQITAPHYTEAFRGIINSAHETTKQISEIAKEYSEKITSLEQELKNYKNCRFKKLVKKFKKNSNN